MTTSTCCRDCGTMNFGGVDHLILCINPSCKCHSEGKEVKTDAEILGAIYDTPPVEKVEKPKCKCHPAYNESCPIHDTPPVEGGWRKSFIDEYGLELQNLKTRDEIMYFIGTLLSQARRSGRASLAEKVEGMKHGVTCHNHKVTNTHCVDCAILVSSNSTLDDVLALLSTLNEEV